MGEKSKSEVYAERIAQLRHGGIETPWDFNATGEHTRDLAELNRTAHGLALQNRAFLLSNSWRVTAPLRWFRRQMRQAFPSTKARNVSRQVQLSKDSLTQVAEAVCLEEYAKQRVVTNWIMESADAKSVPRSIKSNFWDLARYHLINIGIPSLIRGDRGLEVRLRLGEKSFDFDEAEYLNANFDAQMAVRKGKYKSGFDHFCQIGFSECVLDERSIYGFWSYPRVMKVHWDKRLDSLSNLVIYAHFDSDGVIDDHVQISLREYRKLGFEICFITNITDNDVLSAVDAVTTICISKNDAGRDFGSWMLALSYLGEYSLNRLHSLILTNDSVYFPIVDPEPMFKKAESLGYDIFGITDSVYDGWHVQSYFLLLNRAALRVIVPKIIDEFSRVPFMTRSGIIRSLELGITNWAQEAGLRIGAAFSILDAREDAYSNHELKSWKSSLTFDIGNVDPTHQLFDLVVLRYHAPIIKTGLLSENPWGLNLIDWELLVDPEFHNVDVIKSHLLRKKRAAITRESYLGLPEESLVRPAQAQLVRQLTFKDPNYAHRLVFFAHYDPQGIIDDHVIYTLDELKRNGCDIVFVTATANDIELEKLNSSCRTVLVKTDAGRDFGSYKLATQVLRDEISKYRTLIWANDAQYFPLQPLSEIFSIMDRRQLDYWGIVDNHTETYHLMTFFVHFSRRVLESAFIDWFLEDYRDSDRKFDVIRSGEMRVAIWMMNHGFRVGALTESKEVSKSLAKKGILTDPRGFNMNIDFWRHIIRVMKCPALKTELVLKNPLGDDLSDLIPIIKKYTEYPVELITNHVKRIKSLNASKNKPWQIDTID